MSALRHYVVGIDPSLTATGIADWRGTRVVGGDAKLGDQRLSIIYEAIRDTDPYNGRRPADAYRDPSILAVVEALPGKQPGAASVGMAHGAVRLGLREVGIAYITINAATLKKYATGRGGATKPDMRMALYQRAGLDLRDDNEADAWWLRQAGLDAVGHPDAIKLPKVQRESLLKVTWPEDVAARLLEPYETPLEVP